MDYVAFVDGSYGEYEGKKMYGSAAIYAPVGTTDWTILKYVGDNPEYLQHRNVAGEVFAVISLCNHVLENVKDCSSLLICYDYTGIEMWPTNTWKAKKPLSIAYKNYMQQIAIPQLKIKFQHTPGHSGNEGNEIVDKLAREVVYDKLRE